MHRMGDAKGPLVTLAACVGIGLAIGMWRGWVQDRGTDSVERRRAGCLFFVIGATGSWFATSTVLDSSAGGFLGIGAFAFGIQFGVIIGWVLGGLFH